MSVFDRLALAAAPIAVATALGLVPAAASAEDDYSSPSVPAIEEALRNLDFSTLEAIAGGQILGAFQGAAHFTASGCADPTDDGPASGTVTVVALSVAGVEGFGVLVPDDPDAGGIAVFDLGNLDLAGGPVSGSLRIFADDGESTGFGEVSGNVSGNALTLTFDAEQDPPESCTFNGSAALNRVDLAEAVTQKAAPVAVVVAQNLVHNTRAIAGAVASRIRVALGGAGRGGASRTGSALRYDLGPGLNAGDDLSYDLPFGVWASYTRADFADDFAATAFDGNRNLAIGGFDFAPFENALLGLSLGWEGASTDTFFNRGEVESDGILVSPYFAYMWADTWQIDTLFGYTSTHFDQFRTTLGGSRVDSDTQSDRYFWGGNFTGYQQLGNWYFAGRFGLLWMREYIDGFTESNGNDVDDQTVELSQWRFGADANYTFENGFQPFASVTYERDFSRAPITVTPVPGDDDDGYVMNAGLRYFHESGFTGSLEWNGILGRSAYEENAYTIYLRKQF